MSSISKCEFLNCNSIPTFNFNDQTVAKFCSKHKLDNMIQISFVGCKWTKQEDEQLLNEIKSNMDFDDIARIHKRSELGIKKRIEIIAYDMYFDEIPIDDIISKTKISKEQISNIVKEKQQKYEKKSGTCDKKQKKVNNNNLVNNNIETDIVEIKKQLENINSNIENLFNLFQTFVSSQK